MIGAAAQNPRTGATPTHYFNSAREGFQAFLSALNGSSSVVLLPAFIGQSTREGSGVLDPIRQLGLKPRFYKINPDITLNASDFIYQLHAERPLVAVLIQYYGRTDPSSELVARACHARGVPLVEDGAHGLLSAARSNSRLGRHGDAVLYSLHKMLPLASGGMVRLRDPAFRLRTDSRHDDLPRALLDYDLQALGNLRRRNFRRCVDLLAASRLFGDLYHLPWTTMNADVPQTVPVVLQGVDRDQVYFGLRSLGIGAVSLYHTLVDEIGPDHGTSIELSHNIINLPIHQDLALGDVDATVDAFLAMIESVPVA